jgi:dihydrodipicolinate synthase/N-acetylneuraminate lyase
VVRGALAAAVTPLRDSGERLDDEAVHPYVDFLAAAELDGIFALGTTGEGLLLTPAERRTAAGLFIGAAGRRLAVVVHCGAQTTGETVDLAANAAELGADGVAVVAPPYYAFDEPSLVAHFAAAAAACAPTPFYLYEFAARSGYAIRPSVVVRVREAAPNLVGMKVSDSPFDRVEPYLDEGLDVFIGAEALVAEGLARGAVGAVSGLAAAFPEPVVALVRDATLEAAAEAGRLREALQIAPLIPAAKRALMCRGVPVREDVRAPLRPLTDDERDEIDQVAVQWLESSSPTRVRHSPPAHSRGGNQASRMDPLLAAGGTSLFPRSPSTAPAPDERTR